MQILLEASTAAFVEKVPVRDGQEDNIIIKAGGLVADSVKIQFTMDSGVSYEDLYINGELVACTATNKFVPLNAAGRYRLVRVGTADTITIGIEGID